MVLNVSRGLYLMPTLARRQSRRIAVCGHRQDVLERHAGSFGESGAGAAAYSAVQSAIPELPEQPLAGQDHRAAPHLRVYLRSCQ